MYTVGKRDNLQKVRLDLLTEETEEVIRLVDADDYEVVFGHHDLQHGNILTNSTGDLMFVDFE